MRLLSKTIRIRIKTVALAMAGVLLLAAPGMAVRLKDIVSIQGVRTNQLVGYGLVVGLDGTGDGKDAGFTFQSLSSMLDRMGISVKAADIEKIENVAAVMVTADLPAFARTGSRMDVKVSSIGDAENLQGGTLLLTPMKGVDGNIYAVAQGSVSTGGFGVSGAGASVQKNFPTVGRVVNGAIIEKEIPSAFNFKDRLTLHLNTPDFTTATRVIQVINAAVGTTAATTTDAGTIQLALPEKWRGNAVGLVSMIENLNVTPDAPSKVVVNERTGTVVMGENVSISTVAIAHGNLSVEIKEQPQVSQPLPFSGGTTQATPDTTIAVKEGKAALMMMNRGVSLGEVVRALNSLGVSPRDLIAILQAMKAAGALQAQLEII